MKDKDKPKESAPKSSVNSVNSKKSTGVDQAQNVNMNSTLRSVRGASVRKNKVNDNNPIQGNKPAKTNQSLDLQEKVVTRREALEGTEHVDMKYAVDASEEEEFTDKGDNSEAEDGQSATESDPEESDEECESETLQPMLDLNVRQPQNEQEAVDFLASNPYLGNLFRHMIKEGIQEEVGKHIQKVEQKLQNNDSKINAGKGNKVNGKKKVKPTVKNFPPCIKSPSDTTIYAPALRQLSNNDDHDPIIDKISNFVDEIRLETEQRKSSPVRKHQQKTREDHDLVEEPQLTTSAENANKLVVEAEQFHAAIEGPPKGTNLINFLHDNGNTGNCVPIPVLVNKKLDVIQGTDDKDDDEYFHLTCHVDDVMISKIERGEFVELERLLPKRRSKTGDENRLEWVNKDGMTYLAPTHDREQRINNIRKWEQAF